MPVYSEPLTTIQNMSIWNWTIRKATSARLHTLMNCLWKWNIWDCHFSYQTIFQAQIYWAIVHCKDQILGLPNIKLFKSKYSDSPKSFALINSEKRNRMNWPYNWSISTYDDGIPTFTDWTYNICLIRVRLDQLTIPIISWEGVAKGFSENNIK